YMLPWTPWERSQAEAARKAREELLQRRLAHLAADPLRRKYVALIKGGEHWTDEQIDYDIDPAWTVTCPHLRPIEKAMRAARLPMRRGTGAQVDAACVVDEDRLKRDFTASGPAGYHEFEYYDHSPVA